jgi:uncharacterized protein with GYD domain
VGRGDDAGLVEERETGMAKYLVQGSFSSDGLQGLMKEGGTSRRDAIAKMLAEIGGSLEAFYFGFGGTDVFVLADVPDNITAAALGMTVGASGAVATSTVVLLTPEEIDAASKKAVPYRPPGR